MTLKTQFSDNLKIRKPADKDYTTYCFFYFYYFARNWRRVFFFASRGHESAIKNVFKPGPDMRHHALQTTRATCFRLYGCNLCVTNGINEKQHYMKCLLNLLPKQTFYTQHLAVPMESMTTTWHTTPCTLSFTLDHTHKAYYKNKWAHKHYSHSSLRNPRTISGNWSVPAQLTKSVH